jgi:hypothetical protein
MGGTAPAPCGTGVSEDELVARQIVAGPRAVPAGDLGLHVKLQFS